MNSYRIEKVSVLLKKELSKLIIENVSEECGVVTVTDLEITADFKETKVYISMINQENETKVLEILQAQVPAFQKILGKKLRMKFTPKIHFVVDHYQEKIDRVEKLLGEINHGS